MSLAEKIRRRCSVMATPGEMIAERDGRTVARLSDPLLEDMFWLKWQITPLVADVPVTSADFWNDSEIEKIVFRCKRSDAVAAFAFWAGSRPVRDGRLILRGAYVPIELKFRRRPVAWLRLFLFGGGAYELAADDA